MQIHRQLKKLRKELKLSQQQIASLLHISQNAYSAIETGKTKLDINRIQELARVLKVPLANLMADDKLEKTGVANKSFDQDAEIKIGLLESELAIKDWQLKVLIQRSDKH